MFTSIGLAVSSCKKEEITSETQKSPTNVSSSVNESNEKSHKEIELYFLDEIPVHKSVLKLNQYPAVGTEVICLEKQDTSEIHYFTSASILEKWASKTPGCSNLLSSFKLYDDLATKVEVEGVVDYYEKTGEIRKDFKDYLLANPIYNYKDTTMKTASVVLGQFFQAPNSFGPNIPIYTFPYVGSSFNDVISSHQAIGGGLIILFDARWWAPKSRLITFVVLAYSSKSYNGFFYNNATTSVAVIS